MDLEKEKNKDLQQPQILKLDDDFSLVKRFIEGDKSTFRILVQRHKEKVRNIIYLTIGNSNLVDDISQDVFITVYKNLKNFRFESQFSTWLYRITVNKCKDHLRKISVRRIFVPINNAEETTENSVNAESNDISGIVNNAIQQLPARLRIPLVLKDIEGFSYQEIAESTSSELGTVKSRIFRAREALKKILEPMKSELMV
jgi:RNA polymerase sigma-70 factor (ECF subfamily)